MALPFVSVIIVNYNGAYYLRNSLDALRAQTYPAERFEVIVSDNGSNDGSLELLQTNYPWVGILDNQRNLGFASGNNIAIKQARGQYLAFLNNDTAAAASWLEELVAVAESNPRVGMATGRLQLFYSQLEVRLESETTTPPNDGRTLGVQVFDVDTGAFRGVVQYLEGFHGRERSASDYFRWTKGEALLGVPVPSGTGPIKVRMKLAASRPGNAPVRVRVLVQGCSFAEWEISGSRPVEFETVLPETLRRFAKPLVQNAGSIIFRNGAGRDRGAFVREGQVFYEIDENQYNRLEEVFAGCGANLLLRKTMLDDVGLLDDDFFMYYEDTDLSWRARLRGWQILYAPQAIVRHIHCGTSEEWSPFFVYHADRNRLAMLFKNASPRQTVATWATYLALTAKDTLKSFVLILRRQAHWKAQMQSVSVHYRVIGRLLLWLPSLWRKRRLIQGSRQVSADTIQAWFVG